MVRSGIIVHDLGSVETESPAIVFNDTLTSEALLCEPTVSSLNNDEIEFRISFDESDDEDCTDLVKVISTNIDGQFTNLEILKCWSLETSRRLFNTQSFSINLHGESIEQISGEFLILILFNS
ncbi:hypothetical protein Tco_1036335, partial [Tanacetum coccineum]